MKITGEYFMDSLTNQLTNQLIYFRCYIYNTDTTIESQQLRESLDLLIVQQGSVQSCAVRPILFVDYVRVQDWQQRREWFFWLRANWL